jgi:hypothetical protein
MTNRVPERPSTTPPAATGRPTDSHPHTPPPHETPEVEHEGGTEDDIGERTGPGAGYDDEPEQVDDEGGVA